MASIIDGKKISADVKEEVKAEVARLKEKYDGEVPGLAVVLVGERPDSATYVRMKERAAAYCGIKSFSKTVPADISEEELLKIVQDFNADPAVNGILVQLPLPKHINEETILRSISVEKDVDGFHPMNIGELGMKGRDPLFAPCTPTGAIELLERSGVKIAGSTAVVVGRSNIVGLPVALQLLKKDATVMICHSRTPDIPSVVRQGDIVIAAVGRPLMVKKDWIKPGAVVIDVGINQVEDPETGKRRLVGDVDYEGVKEVASQITPVPGGVGPMTVALLMFNALRGFKRAHGEK
eukprot:TRINITY_DN80473_c0_g1_i1.p1 TRINITY_DN80473_c0_g1~~TRINITY_DN80473_c0_g1_i1.p1  ORF type:complete len:294 (+),score=100.70 TRINITY_DN80473_c0_g1_i1:143-1024(+)